MGFLLQECVELRNSEEGQTLAEYGLLLILVAIVVMAAAVLLGPKISVMFADTMATFP